MIPYFFTGKNLPPLRFPRIVMTDELRELLREPKRVEKSCPERVAKFCHDTADPPGSGRTCPDEETR